MSYKSIKTKIGCVNKNKNIQLKHYALYPLRIESPNDLTFVHWILTSVNTLNLRNKSYEFNNSKFKQQCFSLIELSTYKYYKRLHN